MPPQTIQVGRDLTRCDERVLCAQTILSLCILPISCALYPSFFSTWSVCSPAAVRQ